MRIICLLSIFCFLSATGIRTEEEFRIRFYETLLQGNPERWDRLLEDVNRCPINDLSRKRLLLEYTYGLIGWEIRCNQNIAARSHLKVLDSLLCEDATADIGKEEKDLYRIAALSLTLLVDKKKRISEGRRLVKLVHAAKTNYPDNPFTHILAGNLYLHLPRIFGGSEKKALECMQQARVLWIEQGKTNRNWQYLFLLLQMTELALNLEKEALASSYLEEVRQREPALPIRHFLIHE